MKGLGEQLRAIGRTVVGHDPLDGDAVVGEPGHGALEEGGGVVLAFGGQQLGIGQPRGVIDADVQEVPAGMA